MKNIVLISLLIILIGCSNVERSNNSQKICISEHNTDYNAFFGCYDEKDIKFIKEVYSTKKFTEVGYMSARYQIPCLPRITKGLKFDDVNRSLWYNTCTEQFKNDDYLGPGVSYNESQTVTNVSSSYIGWVPPDQYWSEISLKDFMFKRMLNIDMGNNLFVLGRGAAWWDENNQTRLAICFRKDKYDLPCCMAGLVYESEDYVDKYNLDKLYWDGEPTTWGTCVDHPDNIVNGLLSRVKKYDKRS